MDQATANGAPPAPADGAAPASPRRTPAAQLRRDLALLALVGVLLVCAILAGFASLYRQFWGPSAFVERYVGLLASGDAARALSVPGVALDTPDLEAAGLPPTSSEALLRSAALNFSLSDVTVTDERRDGDVVEVTVAYEADGAAGMTVFRVVQDGTEGLVPRWSFETSPLAVVDLSVRGSMQFQVNGFEIDKRQVSPDGAEADPLAPVPLLVFSPGVYSIGVDTPTAAAKPTRVLADEPLHSVPLEIQAEPTEQFVGVVQEQVAKFLDDCTQQQVLQPTGCPFGVSIDDRVFPETIDWSIVSPPLIEIVPEGAYWAISPAAGAAHIDVDVRSIFDGSVYHMSEDVPFVMDGTIDILPDGTASILVGSPALR